MVYLCTKYVETTYSVRRIIRREAPRCSFQLEGQMPQPRFVGRVTDTDSHALFYVVLPMRGGRRLGNSMEEELQKLIYTLCDGFPTRDVIVSNISDHKRLAIMAHYAWKHEIGFHPDMFKEALKATRMFKNLSERELEDKANLLCNQADFATSMFHAAFDLAKLSI